MSKASEYVAALAKRKMRISEAENIVVTPPKEFRCGSFSAYVDTGPRGEPCFYCNASLPADQIPAFIAWLRATFED